MIHFSNVSFSYKTSLSRDYTIKSLLIRPSSYHTHSNQPKKSMEDINLTIYKGEKVGIIGQNGSGKTTLIRLIGGLIKPDKGVIQISGTISPLIGLGVGMNQTMSLVENLKLNFLYRGCDTKIINELVNSVLEKSGLMERKHALIGSLSSGTIAKLNFYMGIAIHSDIVLLDEFSAVGDETFIKQSKRDLHQFIANSSTLINVSHNLDFLKEVSDRFLWVRDGKIYMDGHAEEVLASYKEYANR